MSVLDVEVVVDWRSPLSVLFPPVQGAVLFALWSRPVPLTGRAVHLQAGVGSYPGTLNALARLVEHGLVSARDVGRATEYVLNTEHVLYPVVDAAMGTYRPRAELDRRLLDLLRSALGSGARATTVAYFGSYARGEATASSDIDLLLVLPEAFGPAEEDALLEDLEAAVRRWTGNQLQVYATRPSGLARAVEAGDPIIDSWDTEAQMLAGPDLRRRLRALRSAVS
ncbi:nucleotidyltransferase family protein [Quadrisphaera setariae]|uniref:Nucleotidyltransferase domain-containing protein n=1 Tax=Quadrisphaera setariae TaxID=2593304 RepID=A0A5C8ZFM0_9ACTN|nr:nucleotidyltransferase domain-containing protein [Quadrisphaera setariae]TXR56304.1 nucleotidyltransferase domain-containing protein [Quadrisphaera setariae]